MGIRKMFDCMKRRKRRKNKIDIDLKHWRRFTEYMRKFRKTQLIKI